MREFFTSRKRSTSAALICVALTCLIVTVVGLGSCVFNASNASSNAKYKNAVYIYMCGSTLETKNAVASKNIASILDAKAPADTAIIIETGGTRKWRGQDIPNDALVRYLVRDGQLVELERESDASMGEAQTLSSFLAFCEQNYSAENETFLFWNHGAGSIKGVCLDENHGFDGLTPAEMNQAFAEADAHFNTVCFDACLMANFETARVVANHANTMIASEEIEPSAGWNYKTFIEGLGSASFADKVLTSYKQQCEENGKRLWTLSAIDLNTFAKVESTFDAFCAEVLSKKADGGALQDVTQAAIDAMSFGEQNTQSNFVDLAQFAQNTGFDSLAEAIKNCTHTVNGEDRQQAFGISVFFPLSGSAALGEYLSSTTATSEAYSLFLGRNFSNNASNQTAITFTDEGSVDGTSLNFAITQGSSSKVQSVVYDVYQLVSDESGAFANANCLGFSNDVSKQALDKYSITFNGAWVALNGHLLTCEPIDSVGDVTVFSAPVKLNNNEGDLRFTFNAKTNSYTLQGFVANEANNTQGRLEDVKQGDEIVILAEKFKDSETLDTEFNETSTIIVGDDLELSSVMLPDGHYQIYGIVTDLYGNEYLTRDFIVRLEGGTVVEAKAL